MIKNALLVAALAAGMVGSFAGGASATDNTQYALYSTGKSSDDSWDRCQGDRGPKNYMGSGGSDRDDRRCVSKRRHADNGWGNGGDTTNPGSDNGKTKDTKLPSQDR